MDYAHDTIMIVLVHSTSETTLCSRSPALLLTVRSKSVSHMFSTSCVVNRNCKWQYTPL